MGDQGDELWAQCERCDKWRRLPSGTRIDENAPWYCEMNPDRARGACNIPEEKWDEAEESKYVYNAHAAGQANAATAQNMTATQQAQMQQMQQMYQQYRHFPRVQYGNMTYIQTPQGLIPLPTEGSQQGMPQMPNPGMGGGQH